MLLCNGIWYWQDIIKMESSFKDVELKVDHNLKSQPKEDVEVVNIHVKLVQSDV